MIRQPGLGDSLATDFKGIDALRNSAREQSPDAMKATAKQFEALFLNMVMKGMRDATPQEGLFDNDQSRMFTSMLDQQLSQTMSQRGVGLADVLMRQLSRLPGAGSGEAGGASGNRLPDLPAALERALAPDRSAVLAPKGLPDSMSALTKPSTARAAHVRAFEDRLAGHAEEASRATGIPAKFMLGQAALESGWGRREIRASDGSTSHNLFGIKAGRGWKGKVVEAVTTEYIGGVPQKRVEKFRAYDSYADAFKDYARLLRNNPRYEQVLANAQDARGFAEGLQRAGYATDPLYASKLMRIIRHSLSA